MQFITDKKRWNVFVQVSLVRLSAEDPEAILRWAGTTA